MLQDGGQELKIIEFLAILAALLGVVYSVLPTQPAMLGSFPTTDLFAAYLLFFMMYSAIAYVSVIRSRPNSRNLVYGSLALFSILLAYEFVLTVLQVISNLPSLIPTQSVLTFFGVVLIVFFLLYYILVRIVRPGIPHT